MYREWCCDPSGETVERLTHSRNGHLEKETQGLKSPGKKWKNLLEWWRWDKFRFSSENPDETVNEVNL